MIDPRKCPDCHHPNVFDASVCENCGATLDSDTTIWSTSSFKDIARPVQPATEFKPETIYLYVAGGQTPKPIEVQVNGSVVLGRSTDTTASSKHLVDFSRFQAYLLGVSRRHALISHDDVGYSLEDLESANGTLLNGNRLLPRKAYPLRSGDHIQLGDMLLLIYFI